MVLQRELLVHSSGPPLHHHPKTLELLPVTCMNAGTVEVESYVKPEQMTVEDWTDPVSIMITNYITNGTSKF